MTRFFYGQPSAVDFSTVGYQFPESAFDKPTSSTVPLLAYWRNRSPERFAELLELPSLTDTRCCFEYPVASGGGGKPSFTDLMVLSAETAIGIEGKWTEGMYDVVGAWK